MALINRLVIDHCFVTGRRCDNHHNHLVSLFMWDDHVCPKNNCTDLAKVFFFFFQVGLMKNTANAGTTWTVRYHGQNLPQKCKPQQFDCRPRLAVSWETGWNEFTLVQCKILVTSDSKTYWSFIADMFWFYVCTSEDMIKYSWALIYLQHYTWKGTDRLHGGAAVRVVI